MSRESLRADVWEGGELEFAQKPASDQESAWDQKYKIQSCRCGTQDGVSANRVSGQTSLGAEFQEADGWKEASQREAWRAEAWLVGEE